MSPLDAFGVLVSVSIAASRIARRVRARTPVSAITPSLMVGNRTPSPLWNSLDGFGTLLFHCEHEDSTSAGVVVVRAAAQGGARGRPRAGPARLGGRARDADGHLVGA